MTQRLFDAAEAVIARWDSPQWNWGEPTAGLIHELREAVAEARGSWQARDCTEWEVGVETSGENAGALMAHIKFADLEQCRRFITTLALR